MNYSNINIKQYITIPPVVSKETEYELFDGNEISNMFDGDINMEI